MPYYDSIEKMYEVYEEFLKRVLTHPKVGPKLGKAKVKIRFNYTEPDGSILLDLTGPGPEGMHGNFKIGDTEEKADVTLSQSADLAHRFWQGKENAVLALASGKIKGSGAVQKAMGLVTAIRPTFSIFKDVLREKGLESTIVE